jgi:hypothetical protein
VADWDEAAVKLNRLIHRRSGDVGRFKVKESVNPIIWDDLVNLKAWSYRGSYVARKDSAGISLPFRTLEVGDLPAGFGFDKFGLMVRKEGEQDGSGGRKRRGHALEDNQARVKRVRIGFGREISDEERMQDLGSVLRYMDEEFAEKERLSREQAWYAPISHKRKVSTVQDFYQAFHDTRTLPIHTCTICYLKFGAVELVEIDWGQWMASPMARRDSPVVQCGRCFPAGEAIRGCADCVKHLRRGALSPAGQVHLRLGCEHMFPDELQGLTPVEEKLITLNSYYGFITKYSLPEGHRQSVRYPKHIKGHITVFPNNV